MALQKSVDLSKDDLLGDILEDLHSEVKCADVAETFDQERFADACFVS